MLKLIVVTPKGELINDDFEMVSAKGDQGEIGILENRLPIILKITKGYVKGVKNNKDVYAAISKGILDNNNSVVTVVCEEAMLGENYEDAYLALEKRREEIRKQNKANNFDFAKAEKDLAKAIKESKASQA